MYHNIASLHHVHRLHILHYAHLLEICLSISSQLCRCCPEQHRATQGRRTREECLDSCKPLSQNKVVLKIRSRTMQRMEGSVDLRDIRSALCSSVNKWLSRQFFNSSTARLFATNKTKYNNNTVENN